MSGSSVDTAHGRGLELWATHDGGSIWSRRSPVTPPGLGEGLDAFDVLAPHVIGPTDVAFVANYAGSSNSSASFLYVTRDVGTSWTAEALPEGEAFAPPSFIDASRGWVAMENPGIPPLPTRLYATTDGGRTWTRIPANLGAGNIALDFVSSQTGFALRTNRDGSTTLLQTTNGGRTWRDVHPQLG